MKKKFNKRTPIHVLGNNLEFEIPSWNLIYRLLLNLAEAVRKSVFEPDIIVGVSRGGWLPARIISDFLEKPKLGSLATEFYVGVTETRGKPAITQTVSVPVKDKKVLVVDDITDTGESLKLVSTHLKKQGAVEVRVATVNFNP